MSFRIFSSNLFRNILKDFSGLSLTHYEQQNPPSFIIWSFLFTLIHLTVILNMGTRTIKKAHSSGLPSAPAFLRPAPSRPRGTQGGKWICLNRGCTASPSFSQLWEWMHNSSQGKGRDVWVPVDVTAVYVPLALQDSGSCSRVTRTSQVQTFLIVNPGNVVLGMNAVRCLLQESCCRVSSSGYNPLIWGFRNTPCVSRATCAFSLDFISRQPLKSLIDSTGCDMTVQYFQKGLKMQTY